MKPYYVKVKTKSRVHPVGVGPRGKNDYMDVYVSVEDNGESKIILQISTPDPISEHRSLQVYIPGLGVIGLYPKERYWSIDFSDTLEAKSGKLKL